MGVATVAVHSDADAGALHVAMADEAVRDRPGAGGRELSARGRGSWRRRCDTGAEAIHPGYGFLSENPDFVEAVEAAGLVFIGPGASAIRAMGLKDAAKRADGARPACRWCRAITGRTRSRAVSRRGGGGSAIRC